MKKKGLIISTIVMVVVLVASLTTATYAWFNASAEVKVNDVTVSVASATNISIGIAKDANLSRNTPTGYVNGTISYDEKTADPGKGLGTFSSSPVKNGLGSKVEWNWVLSSIGGVSSASGSPATLDTEYNATHTLYNGHLDEDGDFELLGVAKYNGNVNAGDDANTVIYAPFGLRVEKAGMKYLYCDVKVTPDAEFWGIVASLKLEINGTTTPYAARPFAGLSPAAITYQSVPGENSVPTDVTFRFVIAYNADHITYNGETGSPAPTPTIYNFDIRMFLDGEDSVNCIGDATQYGATIGLEFNAAAALPASSGTVVVINLSGAELP